MVIICHGNNRGQLKDVNKHKAWDIEDLIGDISKVETLVGKPKIMILQCCRGGLDFFTNRPKESCCSPSIKWTNGVFTLPDTETDTDARGCKPILSVSVSVMVSVSVSGSVNTPLRIKHNML